MNLFWIIVPIGVVAIVWGVFLESAARARDPRWRVYYLWQRAMRERRKTVPQR